MDMIGKVGAGLKRVALYVPRKVAVGYHAFNLTRLSVQMAREDALKAPFAITTSDAALAREQRDCSALSVRAGAIRLTLSGTCFSPLIVEDENSGPFGITRGGAETRLPRGEETKGDLRLGQVRSGAFAITSDATSAPEFKDLGELPMANPQRARWLTSHWMTSLLSRLNAGSWYLDGITSIIAAPFKAIGRWMNRS
jgi:hypothetical protein